MDNYKSSRLYKTSRKVFFSALYLILSVVHTRSNLYYFSKWIKDDGDNTLLVDYPLINKSLVVDVGGHAGVFSDKVIRLYNSRVIILEPVGSFYKTLKKKYESNPKVVVYKYALSNVTGSQTIYLSGDGTSLVKKRSRKQSVKTVDASEFVNKHKNIDLISINIEGAEYDVLTRLVNDSLLKNIKYIQVQFHNVSPDSDHRRRKIIKGILRTHKIRYQYPYVWESFELRSNLKNQGWQKSRHN